MKVSDCDRPISSRPVGRYRPPRARRSALRRSALLARLHQAMGGGITVLHAPAGYGKTSLLADFVGDVDYSTRWLTLDSASCVPEVFASQLAAALLGEENASPPSSVGRAGDLRAYLGALVAQAADSDEPILLVIDNVHELNEDVDALDLLGWLTESLPDGFEVILSGRALPDLVSLDACLVTGDITLLDAADLAFTVDEVESLCQQHDSGADARAVLSGTHGWPIAVIATLSGALAGAGPRSPIQSAAWERFLTGQVWGSVPEPLRPVLLAASVPPTLDLRSAPRGHESSFRPLVDWLAAHDFLVEGLGDGESRLNPLFRAFLLESFERERPAEFAAAVHETVAHFERDGRVADGLEFALSTHQFEELAHIIEAHGPELLQRGSFALLWHATKAIPVDVIERHDLLAALRARVQAHIGSSAEALDSADALLGDPSVTGAARLHALLARVRALRLSGDRDEMREAFNSVRAVDCENSLLLSELNYHEAEISLSVDNDLARAEQLLRATARQARLSGARVLELLATSTLGQLHTMQGDGPAAVSTLVRAVDGWRGIGHSSNIGWTLNNLGMAYLQVGDFESAVIVLEEARTEGIQCENRRNEAYATASLGDAELALGRWDRARERYEQAIALCAEYTPDQTLASLSIAGLSAALAGLGDLQQADFFARRALLVAAAAGNAFELATCKLQQAAVDSAGSRHDDAITLATDARRLFEDIDSRSSIALAQYRLALCQFRAGRRADAQQSLRDLQALIGESWMVSALMPLIRENPMFAQWAASRNLAGQAFRDYIERHAFDLTPEESEPAAEQGKYPNVVATSLGRLSVSVGGREVNEEAWASARAKELFYLFLSHRNAGLRKEEAVELLYPDLPREKCNSAFHSNLYRVRRALYQDSIVKRDGGYQLNPEGMFTWDVEGYESALDTAEALPAGSAERSAAYEQALNLYQGPFADAFYSEWAATIRDRLAGRAHRALAILAGYHAGRGEFSAAADCIERILDESPFNEEAAYQLAAFRTRAGHSAAALAFLDNYRRSYEAEYGEHLPERFAKLRAQIAAGALAS